MGAIGQSAAIIPRTYAELLRCVRQVIGTGRDEVEAAWVRTYHETGRLIHVHLLYKKERAAYGAGVYAGLSADTGVSVRTLRECVQFHRCYPIRRPVAELGWNQCRLLCQVGDEAQRAALVEELRRDDLPTVDLRARVRALNAAARLAEPSATPATPPPKGKLLKPKRGTPDLFRLVVRNGGPAPGDAAGLAVDVGFKLYRPLLPAEAGGLKAGMIGRLAEGGYSPEPAATAADLFTYCVTVRRVIDGDTLHVTIALPHYDMDEKLRLRGLDCPELDTPEGKAAKRFVEALLVGTEEVVITTSKVDKYDRYLADVYLRPRVGEEIFLNNALLAAGHAEPMGKEERVEWTP